MNLNDLKYKITNNWAIKIICLMVAIVIYIFHQVSMLDRKVISIPLEESFQEGYNRVPQTLQIPRALQA